MDDGYPFFHFVRAGEIGKAFHNKHEPQQGKEKFHFVYPDMALESAPIAGMPSLAQSFRQMHLHNETFEKNPLCAPRRGLASTSLRPSLRGLCAFTLSGRIKK